MNKDTSIQELSDVYIQESTLDVLPEKTEINEEETGSENS